MPEKDIRDKAYLNHKDILDLNFIRIPVKEVKAIEKKFHESMEGSIFKIRCWTFIAFYLDSIEISILFEY